MWGEKLPPYFTDNEFRRISKILNSFSRDIDYITTINGVPNCMVIDKETESNKIKPKDGFVGLGGGVVKPIGLANVAKFKKYLDPSIKVIGCGGLSTGEDVFQYILAGADAVEIATQFLIEGENCFRRITEELRDITVKKGYTELSQFHGKLKT